MNVILHCFVLQIFKRRQLHFITDKFAKACITRNLSAWMDLRCEGESYTSDAVADPVANKEMAMQMGDTLDAQQDQVQVPLKNTFSSYVVVDRTDT